MGTGIFKPSERTIMAKDKTVPVATIKSMAGNVPEFPMPVKIKHLNGTETTVEFMAKAMRKTEWAALRDAHLNYVKPTGDEDEAIKFSYTKAVGEDMQKAADLISKCASGWDLADAFTPESLVELEDTFGGALGAVLTAYDAAIFHGRVGN